MKNFEIEIIADTLANLFKWNSMDLKSDFLQSLEENEIHIPLTMVERIFEDFIKLDSLERSSPRFNYVKFISDRYTS